MTAKPPQKASPVRHIRNQWTCETAWERALVDRCVAGDEEAWGQLYDRFSHTLLTAVKLMVPPEQQDSNLAEEIIARVWFALVTDEARLLDRFDPKRKCQLSTYLTMIVKREVSLFFRTERRQHHRERVAARPEWTQNDEPAICERELHEFAEALTPRERDFLKNTLLTHGNGTALCHISPANRWQLTCRIRRKLRHFFSYMK